MKLLLLLLSCFPLLGDLSSHFKGAENKPDVCRMRNIDFIYLINLDQRPEKWAHCVDQLAPYGIEPYRFSAVNGWELSFDALEEVGIRWHPGMRRGLWGTSYLPSQGGAPLHGVMDQQGQTYFCHCMSRGAIGIVLSHLSILQDAYDSGYETIWVMEDDIQVIRDPQLLPGIIDRLDALLGKQGWDILFTDRDTKGQNGDYVPCTSFAARPNFAPANPSLFAARRNLNAEFRQIGARYGAYSMIVRRSGMKKILDFIKSYHIFLPYDMDFYLCPAMRLITVRRDVVSTQPQALSDNGGPNYLNTLR